MNRLLGQFAGSAAILGSATVLNLLFQIVIGRFFGLVALGDFALWRNNVMLGGTVARLGGEGIILRKLPPHMVARSRAGAWDILWFSAKSLALGSLGLGIIAATGVLSAENHWLLYLASASAFGGITLLAATLRAAGQPIIGVAIAKLLTPTLLCFGAFALQRSNSPPLYSVYGLALMLTLSTAGWLTLKKLRTLDLDEKQPDRTAPRQSLGFFIMDLVTALGARGTLLIAGFFITSDSLGSVAITLMLASVTSLPLIATNQVLAPRLSAANADARFHDIRRLLTKGRITASSASLVLALILFAIYPLFDTALIGRDAVLPDLLLFLLCAHLANAIGGSVSIGMGMLGFQDQAAKIMFAAVAVKLVALTLALSYLGIWAVGVVELVFMIGWNGALFIALGRGLTKLEAQA